MSLDETCFVVKGEDEKHTVVCQIEKIDDRKINCILVDIEHKKFKVRPLRYDFVQMFDIQPITPYYQRKSISIVLEGTLEGAEDD